MEEMHATSEELMRRVYEIENTSDLEWICSAMEAEVRDGTTWANSGGGHELESMATVALSVQEKEFLHNICYGDGSVWTEFVNNMDPRLRVLLQKQLLLFWLRSCLQKDCFENVASHLRRTAFGLATNFRFLVDGGTDGQR